MPAFLGATVIRRLFLEVTVTRLLSWEVTLWICSTELSPRYHTNLFTCCACDHELVICCACDRELVTVTESPTCTTPN